MNKSPCADIVLNHILLHDRFMPCFPCGRFLTTFHTAYLVIALSCGSRVVRSPRARRLVFTALDCASLKTLWPAAPFGTLPGRFATTSARIGWQWAFRENRIWTAVPAEPTIQIGAKAGKLSREKVNGARGGVAISSPLRGLPEPDT